MMRKAAFGLDSAEPQTAWRWAAVWANDQGLGQYLIARLFVELVSGRGATARPGGGM